MSREIDSKDIRNVLIIGSIGLGNLLLFCPTLRLLRDNLRQARITLVVLKRAFAGLFDSDPNIDELVVLDVAGRQSIFGKLRAALATRSRKYDLVVTTFPANRLEYNLFSFLAGGRYRLCHLYPTKKMKTLSFLQNIKVPVKMEAHDLEQNLGLLAPLGIGYDLSNADMSFPLSDDDRKFAGDFIVGRSLSDSNLLIGLHPGSSEERGMKCKRWGAEKFAVLGDRLAEEYQARILIFGGPEEMALKQQVSDQMKAKPVLVNGTTIKQTAAIIEKCRLSVCNDSGLMHIAVAMGVKTVGIFGPTDPVRTAPYGKQHIIVRRDLDCSPCWKLEKVGTRPECIWGDYRCLSELSVETVLKRTVELI